MYKTSTWINCLYTKNRKRKRKLLQKKKEISGEKAHTNTRKLNWNVSMITDVFLNQKRVNVCYHMVKMVPCDRFRRVPPEWVRNRKGGGVERMEGKLNGSHLRCSPDINLRSFPINFPYISSTPPPFCLATILVTLFWIYHMVPSLPCRHLYLLSSDWERHLWLSKRFC